MRRDIHSPKTSESSPLRIAEVGHGFTDGRVGMTLCPGKRGPSLRSPTEWHRDLAADLEAIRRWGAEIVMTLVEEWELVDLGVEDLGRRVTAEGLVWLHLPVVDGEPPDAGFDSAWEEFGPCVHGTLADGGRVLIHCRGGLGRAGTVAARLLVEMGADAMDAVAIVRGARPGAIETERQRKYVLRLAGARTQDDNAWTTVSPAATEHTTPGSRSDWDPGDRCRLPPRSDLGHFSGCLLGGAVGDAVGAPLEFLTLPQILTAHGPEGLRDMVPAYGRIGAITDDTQMTLFTAEGLLDAVGGGASAVADYTRSHYEACVRWLLTQGITPSGRAAPGTEEAEAGPRAPQPPGAAGLVGVRALHSGRGPGGTCLSALSSGSMGTPEAPLNDSKGCGGVMRMAPVALLARAPGVVTTPATADTVSGADSRADDLAFEIGSRCAAVTHGHPSGYLAAGALALLISRILAGDTLEAASRRAVRALRNEPRGRECASALEQAMALWHSEAPVTPETVERIGGGWVAEEALAIALFSSLAAGGDFTRGVLLAANHSGDSDSTAAITGNILGALLGREAIPSEWAANVEAGDVIDSLSARLHGVRATLPAPDQRHMVGPG